MFRSMLSEIKSEVSCGPAEVLKSAIPIQKGRLYFAITKYEPKESDCSESLICFSTDDRFQYQGFFRDTGPLCLADLYRYFDLLDGLLKNNPKSIICQCTRRDKATRTNAAYLMGSFAIFRLGLSAQWIYEHFVHSNYSFQHYKDASNRDSSKRLSLLSVFRAVEKAHEVGLMVEVDKFNIEEYDFYFRVENGDINWIVPGKMLAFAGPYDNKFKAASMGAHHPEKFIEIFKKWNVTAVIRESGWHFLIGVVVGFLRCQSRLRLNSPRTYPGRVFKESGIDHFDLLFADGSTPTNAIIVRFLAICHEQNGGIAVHCKAGLGRTGTLISAYLIWKYKMTAPQAIAWCRICRPGSVVGIQQNFLTNIQSWLLNAAPDKVPVAPPTNPPVAPERVRSRSGGATSHKEPHQAEMLNLAKLTNQKLNLS